MLSSLCISLLLLLLLALLLRGRPAVQGADQGSCVGRDERNATSGVITDGAGLYSKSVHCEWLIDGQFAFVFASRYTTSRLLLGTRVLASIKQFFSLSVFKCIFL